MRQMSHLTIAANCFRVVKDQLKQAQNSQVTYKLLINDQEVLNEQGTILRPAASLFIRESWRGVCWRKGFIHNRWIADRR